MNVLYMNKLQQTQIHYINVLSVTKEAYYFMKMKIKMNANKQRKKKQNNYKQNKTYQNVKYLKKRKMGIYNVNNVKKIK